LFIFSLPAFLFSPPSPTPYRSGPGGSGPARAGPVRSGRVRSGPGGSGPVRAGPVRSGRVRSGPGGSGPGGSGLIQGKSGRFSDGIRYRTVTDPARTNKIFKFRSSGKRVDVGVTYVTYLINEMKTA
jgi:hypothetical protein